MPVSRWWAACAAVLMPSLASADQFDLYGFGPRGTAMAGAQTADANDYTATFYNPALLVNNKDVNFGASFQVHGLEGDVQKKELSATLDCKLCSPPPTIGTAVGFVFPLGGKVKNHVAIGFAFYLPAAVLVRVDAPDASTPYWYQYQGSTQRMVLHASAGIKLTDWLNVGLGVQILADLIGDGANVKVDLFSKQVKQAELNSYLATRASPVFGLSLAPVRGLRLGVNFKWEMKLVYQIPAKVDLEGVGVLGFSVQGVSHYSPHTLSFGAAYDLGKAVTLSVDAEWANWSAAPSPYNTLIIDLSGATLNALGLDKALDVASATQKAGFSDTLSVRVGTEYRVSERFAVRAGFSYRPTPVPKQDVAGTNLLDGNTLALSAGFGFNFPDPLEIFQQPITIDLALRGSLILPRQASKDTTDTVPSYTYSARTLGGSAAIRYDF